MKAIFKNKNLMRIKVMAPLLLGLGGLGVLYQNVTTLDELKTFYNAANPYITFKVGPVDTNASAVTRSLSDGRQEIIFPESLKSSPGLIQIMMHEIQHATCKVYSCPMNFYVLQMPVNKADGSPETLYNNAFHASEVSAFQAQQSLLSPYFSEAAKQNPSGFLANQSKYLANLNRDRSYYEQVYSGTKFVVDSFNVILADAQMTSMLIKNGVVQMSANSQLYLQINSDGNIQLQFYNFGKPSYGILIERGINSGFAAGTPNDPVSRQKAFDMLSAKLVEAAFNLPRLNPNTTNGKAQQASNIKALDNAAVIANKIITDNQKLSNTIQMNMDIMNQMMAWSQQQSIVKSVDLQFGIPVTYPSLTSISGGGGGSGPALKTDSLVVNYGYESTSEDGTQQFNYGSYTIDTPDWDGIAAFVGESLAGP